jgi:uncharacterized RDD family membrane protein YckC
MLSTPATDPFAPFAPPTANLDPGAEAPLAEQLPARRWSRWLGAVLDTLLLVPFVAAETVFFGLPKQTHGLDNATLRFYVALLPLEIYQWYLVATTGQSLGKRWTGTKIVRMDGGSVDFMSGVVLRSWPTYLVSILTQLVGLSGVGQLLETVDVLLIFGSSRRTLHDHIAGTKVIAVHPKAAAV